LAEEQVQEDGSLGITAAPLLTKMCITS